MNNITFDECECSADNFIGLATPNYDGGITMSPEGDLYSLNYNGIYLINQSSGVSSLFFALPPHPLFPQAYGFVSTGGGIFYSISWDPILIGFQLIEINTVSGTITFLGDTGFSPSSDLTMFNGEIYYQARLTGPPLQDAIIKLDINNPSNSSILVTYPTHGRVGLSATTICNTLVMTDLFTDDFLLINLIDGAFTNYCSTGFQYITSMVEFQSPTICGTQLDLDCNDSSGAMDDDFNSEEFDCLSDPVPVSDDDIGMLYDEIISEMTVQITGFIPDDPEEILEMTGSVPNINVSGIGTIMITLSNTGGAKSTDFKDALRRIKYNNLSLLPTGGQRTVEVQFTTESGAMSNIATAFIEVNELPLVPVDLGDDVEICEGQTATFNAGNPNANYIWSTNQTSQSITVGNSGIYSVTVSNGTHCPGEDEVYLDVIPVIHVSLGGDTEVCDNENATISIITDSNISVNVEISSSTGGPLTFSNVSGTYTFTDLLSDDTEYTIVNVESSQTACIEITDPVHGIDVNPSYVHSFEVNICDGDSIWLGFYWETNAGVYENTFNTFEGCDSVVTTTVVVSPAIHISAQASTCDSAAAGVNIQYLNNPNGCDTVLTTIVSLLPSDTTLIMLSDCNVSDTGVFLQVLTNLAGCDSLIITNVAYTPGPFTFLSVTTCDPIQLGVFQQLYFDQSGCDSMVVTTVTMAPSDTTYLSATSCDPGSIGVFESLHSNQSGCDSLVITTVSAGIPDSTYLFATSCDSSSLGVFEEVYTTSSGCDSTVFTTVTYSAQDSTFFNIISCDPDDVGIIIENHSNSFGCDSIVTIDVTLAISHSINLSSSSCNPADTGVFVIALINQFGCDSIVTTTVGLLPADETLLFSTTCMSSQAGMFITTHLNQHGCDSIVTHTVSLVPADTTIFSFKTCDPASVGSIQNTFPNQDGCDSLVIEETTLFPLPELRLEVTSDFNGYHISCFGESDGSVIAEVDGIDPLTYLWSTGSNDQSITGLSAGWYSVQVTDGNGCTTAAEVMLIEPKEFSISFMVSQPDCFDQNQGSVTVEQTGGVEPVRYSIDGVNYNMSSSFNDLSGGTYTITALDANDCEVKEIIWINVPLMVQVDLGDDQILYPGEPAIINAIVNVPFDSLASVTWSGLSNAGCLTCLSQPVAPIITTTYSVTVTTNDGCKDDDAMTLFVVSENDVYIPNIFSPNGDGINDLLVIYGGEGVEQISEFVIFDRWGTVVHGASDFQPDDSAHAWDGKMRGEELNPGVFAYKVIVRFVNGESDVRYGDVTLVR